MIVMSSPNHGSTTAPSGNPAAATKLIENVARGAPVETSATSTNVIVALSGNENLHVMDQSRPVDGEIHSVSSVFHAECFNSPAHIVSPAKVTQQSQDQFVTNGHSASNESTPLSKNGHRIEGTNVSLSGHETHAFVVDAKNPHEDGTLTNVRLHLNFENRTQQNHSQTENSRICASAAFPDPNGQVVKATSAIAGQVSATSSSMFVERGNLVSRFSSVVSQESQLGDSSSPHPAEIFESTAVDRAMESLAGDRKASVMDAPTAAPESQSKRNPSQTAITPGATPIVRLLQNSESVVTEKRGRFKVFQPVIDIAAVTTTGNTPTEMLSGTIPQGSIGLVAGTQEGTTATNPVVATQSSQHALHPSNRGKPVTFEGTGAPVVKRKGRFFVTNVKDPGLIAISINPQVVTSVPAQALIAPSSTHSTPEYAESFPVAHTYVHTMAPPVVVPGLLDVHHPMPVDTSSSDGHLQPQPQYQQQENSNQGQHNPDPREPQSIKLQQPTTLQQLSVLRTQPDSSIRLSEATPTELNDVTDEAEKADNTAGRSREHSEASQNHKVLSRRHQSVPKTSRDEHVAPSGLGKVFHFLDQMRVEVSQADKMIKTLQADIRLLKEKNKELETKALDAEKRCREELALREAAEAKMKTLRKKVRSMRDEAEVQKDDDENQINATRPEDRSPDQNHISPATNDKQLLHSTDDQRAKSPEKMAAESQSVQPIHDNISRRNSPSPVKGIIQNVPDQICPPTPPATRRKGASSPNVQVAKSSPSHFRFNSTSHIPSHTGNLNKLQSANTTMYANQSQSRNTDASSSLHSIHAPQTMIGSAKREFGVSRLASTNFDPLAPKISETLDKEVVFPNENPSNNFDPFSAGGPSALFNVSLSDNSNRTTISAIQPAPMFVVNQNALAAPVYGFTGSTFECLDHMTVQNQPMMQVVDHSQLLTPSPSMQEMQQHMFQQTSSSQELDQLVLLAQQHTFQGYLDSDQVPHNQFTSNTERNMNREQVLPTPNQWSQQQNGSKIRDDTHQSTTGASSLSSNSRLIMSSDPFDDLLNRPNQS